MITLSLLDYILVIFVIWGAILGWRRGLLAIIVGFAGVLLAWYVAARYSSAAVHWVDASFGWAHGTAHYLAGRVPLPSGWASYSLANLQPEQLTRLLTELPFPAALQRPLADAALKVFGNASALHLATLGDLSYYSMAVLIWTVITFFVIMSVITALTGALAWGVTRTLDGTPLRGLNHVAGGLLGAAENLVTLVVLAGLLVPILHLIRWPALQHFLEGSRFLPTLATWFQRWSPWKIV
ncbi:MAG: CvpA family protein [Symbiobacteriia bacterium]